MKHKIFAFTLAALSMSLVVPVEAKGNQNSKAQAEQKKKAAEKAARDKKHDAIESFMKQKDTNHDGSLTKDEYLTGEADKEAASKTFDQYNVNKDRYLTKSEIESLLHL